MINMTKTTQATRLLTYLSKNPGATTLTVAQAQSRFGITNPRARIAELREDGHKIVTNMRRGKDGVARAVYALAGRSTVRAR
jgi:DNA-binding IscR family transcriptional regulator